MLSIVFIRHVIFVGMAERSDSWNFSCTCYCPLILWSVCVSVVLLIYGRFCVSQPRVRDDNISMRWSRTALADHSSRSRGAAQACTHTHAPARTPARIRSPQHRTRDGTQREGDAAPPRVPLVMLWARVRLSGVCALCCVRSRVRCGLACAAACAPRVCCGRERRRSPLLSSSGSPPPPLLCFSLRRTRHHSNNSNTYTMIHNDQEMTAAAAASPDAQRRTLGQPSPSGALTQHAQQQQQQQALAQMHTPTPKPPGLDTPPSQTHRIQHCSRSATQPRPPRTRAPAQSACVSPLTARPSPVPLSARPAAPAAQAPKSAPPAQPPRAL